MTDPIESKRLKALLERLRATYLTVIGAQLLNNPDGPEAADEIEALRAKVARKDAALTNPPTHDYWGAGEPDCPRDLKSGNGECWRLRCKVCGLDNPLDTICRAALNNQESP
jgi:hypothetical protein